MKKLKHKREDRTNKQFVFLGEAYRVIKFTYKLQINFFEAGNIYCKPSGRRLVSSHRRFNVDIVSDLLTYKITGGRLETRDTPWEG